MSDSYRKPDQLFGLLAKLTDEDIPDNEREILLYNELNDLQNLVNREFFDFIKSSSYPHKYEFYDRISELLRSLRLRILFPEMIDRRVIGFYHPDSEIISWLYNSFFYLEGYSQLSIPESIPALIVRSDETSEVYALSAGEKRVTLSVSEYADLLFRDSESIDYCQRIEISAVTHLLLIKSPLIPENSAIVVIPKGADRTRKYYRSIFGLIDVLVLSNLDSNDCHLADELSESNISSLFCHNDSQIGAAVSEMRKLPVVTKFENLQQLNELVKDSQSQFRNFNHGIILKVYFSELFWFFSFERFFLNKRLIKINEDGLNEQEIVAEVVKSFKKEVNTQLEKSDEQFKICSGLLDSMLEKFDRIEQICCADKFEFNNHALNADDLSAWFYCMSFFYTQTEYKNRVTAIRDMKSYCTEHGDVHIATIISNDSLKRDSASDDIEYLKNLVSRNQYIGRLKIRHRKELDLDWKSLAEIVLTLPPPLNNVEQLIKGCCLHHDGKNESAREEFFSSMSSGNSNAGDFFLKYFGCNDQRMLQIAALAGYGKASLVFGEQKFQEYMNDPGNDTLFHDTLKFFNIAASKMEESAYVKLFNLWKVRSQHFACVFNVKDDRCKECFSVCLKIGEKCSEDQVDFGVLGRVAFWLEKYKAAMNYLKKSKTSDTYFLRAQMYEQGLGTAKNRVTALKMYEKAMQLGSPEARVNYDRLFAEIEAEKKSKEESKNANYSSSSYTSGYHSYYSGW